ncbi:MAG TPA: hypothetical protein VN704_05420 [Verrucomicrobiae bacterium]|nr:hypothetical protein [Verrucomicrobiae bacterium]
MDKKNDKVIIIEPSIQSDLFLNYLKDVVFNILKENSISLLSIINDGFYFVIQLKKNDELVYALNLLGKIPGISCVFIAKYFVNEYDLLTKSIIPIWKDLLFSGESFHIKIISSTCNKKSEKNLSLKDLEFFLISELTSSCTGVKYINSEENVEKIFFILMGTEYAYVSLLLKKLKNAIPFNFMNQQVTCAIYNDYCFLSIDSILKSGFIPLLFFFYSSRNQLLKFLKIFDKIIKNYPIQEIEINLVSLENVHHKLSSLYEMFDFSDLGKDVTVELFKEQIILFLMYRFKNHDVICLSFLPLLHPFWFIKKNIQLSFQSNKIPLLPFLFEFNSMSNIVSFYKFNNLRIETCISNSFLDANQITFDNLCQKILKDVTIMDDINNNVLNFKLDLRKDDILDILNSV